MLGWLRTELNLWRVKPSVPPAIRVRIRTLTHSRSHTLTPTSPLFPFPFPSLSTSQVARTTTGWYPVHITFLVREPMLSRLRITHRGAPCTLFCTPKVSNFFPPFRVLLTQFFTHTGSASHASTHVQALQHRCALFFFSFDSFWLTYCTQFRHVTTASTARPTTTRCEPQLVQRHLAQRAGPRPP